MKHPKNQKAGKDRPDSLLSDTPDFPVNVLYQSPSSDPSQPYRSTIITTEKNATSPYQSSQSSKNCFLSWTKRKLVIASLALFGLILIVVGLAFGIKASKNNISSASPNEDSNKKSGLIEVASNVTESTSPASPNPSCPKFDSTYTENSLVKLTTILYYVPASRSTDNTDSNFVEFNKEYIWLTIPSSQVIARDGETVQVTGYKQGCFLYVQEIQFIQSQPFV